MSDIAFNTSGGSPASDIARNTATPTPRTGIAETLNAPGLAVRPPVSVGVQRMAQLQQIMGMTGQVIAQAGHMAEQQRRIEQVNAFELDQIHRGRASTDYRTDLVTIGQQIEQRNVLVPDGVLVDDFAEALIDERTEGAPAAYVDSYRNGAKPALVAALLKQQEGIKEQFRGEMLTTLSERAIVARTPEEMGEALTAAAKIAPTLTDTDRLAAVILPAAKSAAVNGDTIRLDAALAVLGERFPAEQQQLKATYEQVIEQRRADLQGKARQELAAMQLAGAPLENLRERVANDARLDDSTRLEMLGSIGNAEAGALRDTQQDNANALKSRVFTRRWLDGDPLKTVDQIIERMDLPAENPYHISADTGQALLHASQQRVEGDARYARLAGSMRDLTRPGVQATPKDDKAMLRVLDDLGIIRAPEISGDTVFDAVNSPVKLAFHVRRFNHLPGEIATSIRQGLGASDLQQVTQATATYAALYAQAPHLAESMELGTGPAALRARFIAARTAELPPLAMTGDEGVMNSFAGRIAREAMNLQPSQITHTPEQLASLTLFNEPANKNAGNALEKAARAKDAIRDGIKGTAYWGKLGPLESMAPGFAGGISISEAPDEVANAYEQAISEEYLFARAITPSHDAALAAAQRVAMERTLAKHPPLIWNGTLYWTNQPGTQPEPHLQQLIESDIMERVPEAERGEAYGQVTEELISDLRANFIPVWDQQQQGYVFRSLGDPYQMKTLWSNGKVQPLVINPFEGQTPDSIAAKVNARIDQLRKNREGSAQREHEARVQMMSDPTGIGPGAPSPEDALQMFQDAKDAATTATKSDRGKPSIIGRLFTPLIIEAANRATDDK